LCDFAAAGLSDGRSPDRLDALVWAVTELALTRRAGEPKVRRV
jgi:phage terminase large subunit-like protein